MSRSTGFWSKGRTEYLKALREEEDNLLSPLRQALESETDPVRRQTLASQIQTIQDEFEEKRGAADHGLFMQR